MTGKDKIKTKGYASQKEKDIRGEFVDLFKQCPIPDNEILLNLNLFTSRQNLTYTLFMNELYQKFKDVHGVMMEFGVRWGRNLALLESLRGIYEPFNYNRKIIGFDSFEGFPSVHEKDGNADIIEKGSFSVTENYEQYLEKVLDYHESESPIAHIKKYELRKGNAVEEIKKYLKENPETIIAFAYFDFDIYEPTKECLEAIKGHVTKGTVIAFDELNVHDFAGETIALKEVFGLSRYKITRSEYSSNQSYIVID